MKIPATPPTDPGKLEDPLQLISSVLLVNVATDRYLSWEQMRWRTPPEGLSHDIWWWGTRVQRRAAARPLPLAQKDGAGFTYTLPDEVLQGLEGISARAGGHIGIDEPVTNPATRDRYLVSSLMEEAITSSQLEGASTTRRVAKEMLREGRRPRTKGEQMIWNNYRAMDFVRAHRHEPLSPDLVLALHEIVTLETLEDPADAGRLQREGDVRVSVETTDGRVVHRPPDSAQLVGRLAALCDFANDDGPGATPWLSPVLRAILVHFMAGYDHYFVDGNGRLARVLFYWVMLQRGLWLTEFVTISKILKTAPVQYAHAFVNSEHDGDVTYFLIHQLGVLNRAFDDLEHYLVERMAEARTTSAILSEARLTLNHRQVAVVESALSDAFGVYTVVSHLTTHRVSHETARQDLMDLAERGLLVRRKHGRQFTWHPAPGLRETLMSGSPTTN